MSEAQMNSTTEPPTENVETSPNVEKKTSVGPESTKDEVLEETKEADVPSPSILSDESTAAGAEATATTATTTAAGDAPVLSAAVASPLPLPSPTRSQPMNADNLGAQILKNRFLSLKERANQNAQTLWAKNSPALSENAKAVQERAGQLWKTAAPILPVTAFRKPSGISSTPPNEKPTNTESEEGQPKNTAECTTHQGGPPQQAIEVKPRQLSLADAQSDNAGHNDESDDTAEPKGTEGDDTSSMGGASEVASLLLTGRALTRASLAASVAFESVATFRGRYNASATTTPSSREKDGAAKSDEDAVTDNRPMPESQLELILKSRVGQHMQEILDKLEPHEYAMLLGRGMLGVNLKQCYLKNHGVFIDFMVPGGQAENSGVIRSGDLPVRLGDIDLRKGTIVDIPKQISQARRPVVLALATGSTAALEKINYIDVTVAMMHRARDYYTKRGSLSNLPSASSPLRLERKNRDSSDADIKSVSKITILPADTIDSFLTPPAPNLEIRRDFQDEVPLRNLDKFLVDGLTQVYDLDSNFREASRHAFLTCALDGRRLPFLSRHFSSGDQGLADLDPKMTPSAQLMLFLELSSFLELYHVTPTAKLRKIASEIAFKFFLPSTVGNKLQLPLFDFHHIVPDASLRHLELVLNAKTQTIPRDLFLDFSKAVVDSLAGAPFISFLTSSECARMRAYLRNTAPYINLPLHELIDALTGKTSDAAAKDCFSYLLLFLICQVEKEPAGEYNFVGDEESKIRLIGAPDDLCCAIFIKRTFIPALEGMKASLNSDKKDQVCDTSVIAKAINAIEHFWDIFIIGTLDQSPKPDEIETPLKAVRAELERVAAEILQAGEGDFESSQGTCEIIMSSKLVETAAVLAEEMIFQFASNINPKFREHKFHEWMCNELSKLRAKDPTWSCKQEIPTLPQGCVKRLLRKTDLPNGVSPHKPHKEVTQDSAEESNYPNAEFAVVFGSTFGSELAGEIHLSGIEASDIRRYTSLPIALHKDHEVEVSAFSADEVIPPTFEGYAIVPSQKPKPFQRLLGDSSVSKDGWEVSLVSFSIPNAESSGASSSLFGVSLFLQCKPDQVTIVHERVDSFVCEKEPTSSSVEFVSPIKISKTDTADSDGLFPGLGKSGHVKNVLVSVPLPSFNDQHKSASWVSRVLGEEYRDPKQPLSIGLALVSRKNVILAMRDTLSRLLFDYSRDTCSSTLTMDKCGPLVDVLGNFANRDVESISLRCILEPYIRAASAPWIERPISSQASIFENHALQLVSDCLPPTPLALMFITALLEQKIILASSRRSILQSATTAVGTLLDPLKWSHLMVPIVPATLAGDLVQYPAPFILGIPSEEGQNEELVASLPRDITLVDLDVGRVILAPDFGLDNEMVQKSEDPAATALALRSQVLYLAQALGSIFGSRMKPQTWLCDRLLQPAGVAPTESPPTDIEALKLCAKSFIAELLEGVSACCYWVEEAAQTYGAAAGEPTVLFDEDKFFEIKKHRASDTHKPLFPKVAQRELALNLTDFDLVLESFLRCQSMSTYISSRPKTDMAFY